MNSLTIIGNLTKDPELRTTTTGKEVCSFTVAVNRRQKGDNKPEADFFDVSVWNDRARDCEKYLSKGKKVCVIGSVSVDLFTGNDGQARARLKVSAKEVEFLSPKTSDPEHSSDTVYKSHDDGIMPEDGYSTDPETGFGVVDTDELPF